MDAAARIDFGGGWTDTPPYSLERNSYVLNAAISLNGVLPITVEAQWLNEPVILLESRDIGEQYSPRYAGDIMDHRNPADPFALAKAALVLKGFVPMNASPNASLASIMRYLPGGIRLTTQTSIPRGSGLGTSSIMAGAVLACLGALSGEQTDDSSLFDQVLSVEQMMTTGGGWQDRVGGLVGGVKLVTSEPGVRQRLAVQPAPAECVEQLRRPSLPPVYGSAAPGKEPIARYHGKMGCPRTENRRDPACDRRVGDSDGRGIEGR